MRAQELALVDYFSAAVRSKATTEWFARNGTIAVCRDGVQAKSDPSARASEPRAIEEKV